ncbi:universal stress protein [Streptomyces durbertensis]|uniref:Universal stress protein n=1 Tax=Streptomyces durbertensis TaxID=2448886 RepID=A0ABR6EKY9_9ACTN|nr:universal stress protein [Streptomyces durbertensis]MBB1246001.1 universal stress protein [Streptomyces durbertensis]
MSDVSRPEPSSTDGANTEQWQDPRAGASTQGAQGGASAPPPVVVGFDNSDCALRAVDRAAEEAALRETGLEILTGWPWELVMPPASMGNAESEKVVREHLDKVIKRVHERYPQMTVEPALSWERAADALISRSGEAALTVVGTRGHGGFVGLLVGSVSLRAAAHTEGPLLVVGPHEERDHGRVLLGLKSVLDDHALEFAFEEAARRNAELRVVHAWQFSPFPDDVHKNTAEATHIKEAVARLRDRFPQVKAEVASVEAPAARELLEQSAEADIVVLAAHRRKRRFGLQLGAVSHALLHHAQCPVAIIPAAA